MNILLIGGTGNLSAAAAATLHGLGHEVAVLSRGQRRVPGEYRAFVADRKDAQSMRSALAGYRPEVVLDFLAYEMAEVQGAREVFGDGIRQYLFISSASVYSKPAPSLPITENSPLGNEWWEYSRKKLACEQWLLEQHRAGMFPVTIVRPSHTYSERWIPNCVSSAGYSFAARLERGEPVFVPEEGEMPWTLTTAADLARGIAGLAGNPAASGETVHITHDHALTWKAIYREIAAALGCRAPGIVPIPTEFICEVAPELTGGLKGDKAHPSVFDNTRVKRLVPGFACKTPFQEGIRESVKWLRAHPGEQNLNPKIDELSNRVINRWRGRAGSASQTLD